MNMKKILFLLFLSNLLILNVFSQEIVVKGTVYDKETGETLPAVSIFQEGKPLKYLGQSKVGGDFSYKVAANATLIFKFLGFADQRLTLKPGQTTLDVRLKPSSSLVKEVVIRGYQQRSKETTVGSSVTISGKEIQDIPVANAEQLLQGKVPGLNIQVNTGAPGFRGSTTIRGVSSMSVTGSNENSYLAATSPMYIVDGVPIDADNVGDYGFNSVDGVSPLSLIPPEDIQSIEVLKDAQATVLYGSRGAYGVIIIQTKRGNSKVPRVAFDSKVFVNAAPKLRETFGGQAERRAKLEQLAKYGNDATRFSYMLVDSLNPYYNNSTDWQSVFYGTTYNQTHNLTVDGGDEKFNYKTNFKLFNSQGILANTGFNSYTATMNMGYNPSKKFRLFFNVQSTLGKRSSGGGNGLMQQGVANTANTSSLLPGPTVFQATSGIASAFSVKNDNATKNLRANAEFSFMPINGLSFTSNGSYDFTRSTDDTFTPAVANTNIQNNQNFSQVYAFAARKSKLYNRNVINFNKTINGGHNFNFLFFNEIEKASYQAGYVQQFGTANDQIEGPLGANTRNSRGGGVLDNYYDVNSLSFAGGFSYDFQKKYIADFNIRYDGSSLSGFEDPYTQSAAVGVRWNFNKERILQNADWLTLGSVRASWGRVIKPAGNVFSLYGNYFPTGTYLGNGSIGIDYNSNIPNSTLRPSTATTYNLAFDLAFFNDHLRLTYETYTRLVANLLGTISLSQDLGFANILSDDGKVLNYGHELNLDIRPLARTSKVNLSFNINGALNRSRIVDLWGGINQFQSGAVILREGNNPFAHNLIVSDGVYTSNDQVPVDPFTGLPYRSSNNATAYFKEGDPRWKDLNGDYIVNEADRQMAGDPIPLVVGGLTTQVGYKGFSLLVTGAYTYKRSIVNRALSDRLKLMSNPYGSGPIVDISDIDYYKGNGVNATFADPYNYKSLISPFREDQTSFFEDGSYFKINTAVLSYSFKKDFLKKYKINGLKVFMSGYNLFTFSRYSGPNPEAVTDLGFDKSDGYPVARMYSLGLNVQL